MAETNNFVTLGHSNLKISRIGLGCMGLSDYYGNRPTDDQAVKLIHRCIEIGINFFDTAYVYAFGVNEELLGKAIREAIAAGKIKRQDVVIATKYGIIKNEQGVVAISSSPENVKAVIDGSLKRLDIGYIDLVYQHRVDPKTPIEDTIRTVAEYVKEGKVKTIGLSEAGVNTIRRAHAVHPISALQTEYSLWTTDPETNGLLDVCRELGITFVAYSPLGRGFLTGSITKPEDIDEKDWRRKNPRFVGENFTKNLDLVRAVQNIAKHKGCNPNQLALAWVLRQPGVVTIPGSTKIQNMEDNVGAYKITLTDEDNAAIKKILDQFVVSGGRYDESSMTLLSL